MMNYLLFFISFWFLYRFYASLRFGKLAFVEFFMGLYSVNYLIAPSLIYLMPVDKLQYAMKIESSYYFGIVLIGFIFMYLGLISLGSNKLELNLEQIRRDGVAQIPLFNFWIWGGCALIFIRDFLPSELAFFAYLLASLRYVGVFSLFLVQPQKAVYKLIIVFLIEISIALRAALFHDLVIWIFFFVLLAFYSLKEVGRLKPVILLLMLLGYFVLQNTKSEYRASVNEGNAGADVFLQTSKNTDLQVNNDFWTGEGVINALTRLNQGWITSSTILNMDETQNFQGTKLLMQYIESAVLPRFLAPDKLRAGDKTIFNEFSGHSIQEGTSMGLGIFSDGYIAYGVYGVYVFCFCFGLLFALIFRLVKKWQRLSPFFLLFMMPILSYAVRPDCETQTTVGHIIKSLFVYSILVQIYKYRLMTSRYYLMRKEIGA